MKKFLVLLVALTMIAGLGFAQEEGQGTQRAIEFFDWEFHISYPVHWSNGRHTDGDYYPNLLGGSDLLPDRTVTANTAIGTSINMNFSKSFGLTLDFDFSYMTKLVGIASSQSDSASMFGMNIFLGPQFYVVNSDRLRVPLAVGFHMYYFADEYWMPELLHENDGYWVNRRDIQFGPGVMFGVQFHFDNSIYLYSRTSVYIDFIRLHKVEGILNGANAPGGYEEISHTDVFEAVYWTIKPTIGIGVKF